MPSEMLFLKHNSDIKWASTLPSPLYTEDEYFKKEMTEIFDGHWNLLGSTRALAEKGGYFTAQAGLENFLIVNGAGDPKDPSGFVNVCRHRAGPVALGSGHARAFQCRYHGWTYDLTGNLVGTPEFQGVEGFKKEDNPLPKISVALLGPLVFGSLSPDIPIEKLKNLEEILDPSLEPFFEKDYQVDCNWKVYVDNYLEGYHLPLVHKGLSSELDYSQYRTEVSEWYSEQMAPAKASAALYRSEEGTSARYFWLFPNTMLNIYQGLVQTNTVIPVSKNQTVVKFVWYTTPEKQKQSKERIEQMMKFSDVIQEEDRVICEQVQKNLRSQTYSSGRYSVKRENGVHHFHHLIAKCYRGPGEFR